MMTHTLAILERSPIAYGEVADKLRAAASESPTEAYGW